MRRLSDTIARLGAMRGAGLMAEGSRRNNRLSEVQPVDPNPGALRAYGYVPGSVAGGAALVVVLHGCTQSAADYDTGAGWSEMAERHGFALLFPEQQRQNNPNLCFNWFSPEDSRRGSGEALSIRRMIAAMVEAHAIDPARVFVTGLSAGGAMASVMLATYPEVFAGGAIIAGLPYGCASTIPQAFDRMRGHGLPDEATLAGLVRTASDHTGPWPTISVWHGSADATVSPATAAAIVGQWRILHGAGAGPDRVETSESYSRRVWCDRDGREVIDVFSITGIGHGTPLKTSGDDGCGRSGAYMLEAGISSTGQLCRSWGLLDHDRAEQDVRGEAEPAGDQLVPLAALKRDDGRPASLADPHHKGLQDFGPATGVGKVIEDALRSAGLMR